MTIRVLHICNDYAKQKLYAKFFCSLANVNVSGAVYCAVRTHQETTYSDAAFRNVVIKNIIKKYDKVFFNNKIRRVYSDLINEYQISNYDLVHAHFLYSDGAVALKLWEQYGIPYVVSVRNTDMNSFMRLRKDLWPLVLRITRNAKSIIFLNKAYKERFLSKFKVGLRSAISQKCYVIPNGIHNDWFDKTESTKSNSTLRIIYVGDLSLNKNLTNSVLACEKLREIGFDLNFNVIGDGGNGKGKFLRALRKSDRTSWLTYFGRINDFEKLRNHYLNSDIFLMPSFTETFGLSYIEAISQNTKVVFSSGEGIDGYFPENIARAVNPRSVESIVLGILKLLPVTSDEFETLDLERFDWNVIARQYVNLYREALL